MLTCLVCTILELCFDFEFATFRGDIKEKSMRILSDFFLNQIVWNKSTYNFAWIIPQNEEQTLFVLQTLLLTKQTLV